MGLYKLIIAIINCNFLFQTRQYLAESFITTDKCGAFEKLTTLHIKKIKIKIKVNYSTTTAHIFI